METHRAHTEDPLPPETKEQLRRLVAAFVEATPDELADHADLIDWGLDSITIMQVTSAWQRNGIEVTYADLVHEPTVSRWWELLEEKR